MSWAPLLVLKSGLTLGQGKELGISWLATRKGAGDTPRNPLPRGRLSTALVFIPSTQSFIPLVILHSAQTSKRPEMVTGADGKGRSADSPQVRLAPLLAGWWPPREVKPAVRTHAIHRITPWFPKQRTIAMTTVASQNSGTILRH